MYCMYAHAYNYLLTEYFHTREREALSNLHKDILSEKSTFYQQDPSTPIHQDSLTNRHHMHPEATGTHEQAKRDQYCNHAVECAFFVVYFPALMITD